jgi:mannosyltransferase OCH1-like enzyme
MNLNCCCREYYSNINYYYPRYLPEYYSYNNYYYPRYLPEHYNYTPLNSSINKIIPEHFQTNLKTNRNYDECIVKTNKSDIEKINNYFKNNPQKIPKIIHQIWIGNKDPPYNWINTFKFDFIKKYPEYKYKLWREKDIENFNLVNKNLYNNEKELCGKADILRYEILYNYGGIYIDADSVFIDNDFDFNNLMKKVNNSGFFIAEETKNGKGLANGVIGCSKNNPIMKLTIDILSKQDCKNAAVFKKFGPFLMDQILLSGLNITIFPSKYFYPEYWHGIKKSKPSDFKDSCFYQYGYSTNNLKDKIKINYIEFKKYDIILSFEDKYKYILKVIEENTKKINLNIIKYKNLNKNIIYKNKFKYDCNSIILAKILKNKIYLLITEKDTIDFFKSCININFINNISIVFNLDNLKKSNTNELVII